MDKKEILNILNNAKDERGDVPMRLVRQAFDKLVQPDKRTDKRTETHGVCLDTISKQAAVELAMKYCPDDDGTVQCDGDIRGLLDELENLPPVQPDRELIDDYMWKIKQNISPHTSAEGVIAIKYYLSQIYEQIYGKGEKPKWMT